MKKRKSDPPAGPAAADERRREVPPPPEHPESLAQADGDMGGEAPCQLKRWWDGEEDER